MAAEQQKTQFDPNRAMLRDKPSFEPFYVEKTRLLRQAIENGKVAQEADVLVTELDSGVIALLTNQMVYHHVAQGEWMGEPWLVTF